MWKILIVEDEKPISELVRMNLALAGYECRCVYDGKAAADLLTDHRFDLILLDVMLPEADGFELMEFIRPLAMPVIFLTARADVADRVKGLRLGADDYIVKPFAVAELIARVDVVLRRYYKTDEAIGIGDVVIRPGGHSVTREGKPVELTPKEYELLLLFVQNRGVVLFRDVIYERVWGPGFLGESRTVDLHLQRLRKKLGWETRLITVHRIGYRLEAEP